MRFTVGRLMAGIAVCGVAFAVLRQAPSVAMVTWILVIPFVGSLWDIRRGGKGLRGALAAGAITWGSFGLAGIVSAAFRRPGTITNRHDLVYTVSLLCLQTIVGSVYGLVGGLAVCYLRYLATLPKSLRLRAERSAGANSYRPQG